MTLQDPGGSQKPAADYAERLDRLGHWAVLLDSRFRIPGTQIRFGWDPIAGIVPIIGDLVMAAVALRLILLARELGADRKLILKMVANVAADTALGVIPIAGPLLDIGYRANLRNLKLITHEFERRRPDRSASPALAADAPSEHSRRR
jgi:hypothetical protein